MLNIAICDDDANYISELKEMLLECNDKKREIDFWEFTSGRELLNSNIDEVDVIFLDISTINIELVKLIVEADRPVTVVTNMIDAILIMLHEKDTKTKLIFLGGKLNRGRDGFVGTITNRNISNYQFDKAFMGVVGIDVNRNRVYTYDTEDALTKKSVMEVSNECYMLMEREKLSKDGNYKYAGIDEFTGLIMEESVEGSIMSKLKSYNINIYC